MANTKITNPELFNLGDSTSATQLPVMTTTERIAMTGLSVGETIFNSTTDKVEYWDGTKWYGITSVLPNPAPSNSVVFLDPSNINSYPGTGNTWTDLSTSGSDATLFNTSFSGTAGTNGYFNMSSLSSNSRLNTTGNSLVGWGNNVTSSLSISIWYYPTQTSGFGYIYSKTTSNGFEYALLDEPAKDRKSTRLNSSHRCISYAVFCLIKKNIPNNISTISHFHSACYISVEYSV